MRDRIDAPATLAQKLNALLVRLGRGKLKDGSLVRLTAGAHQETWAFAAIGDAGAAPLILRRLAADAVPSDMTIDPETEAQLIRRAGRCGVPVAAV